MRWIVVPLIVMAMSACRGTRTVKIGWDVPATLPDGYRVLVDDRVVMEIPPPPIDDNCHCLTVAVTVPRGEHTLSVVAYNRDGATRQSASLVVH
jgi:hypothetical protein